MQQRFTTPYSTRVPDEERGLKSPPQQPPVKHSPRTTRPSSSPTATTDLEKRNFSQWRSYDKWAHAIPVVVFLCFFTLWWFSFPVNLVIKDGRIMSSRSIEMKLPLNNTHISLGIVAAAISPLPSVPQNLTANNVTEVNSPEKEKGSSLFKRITESILSGDSTFALAKMVMRSVSRVTPTPF